MSVLVQQTEGLSREAAEKQLGEPPTMPGEMALRMRSRAMGLPERAGGLEDQPYALVDAFLILDVVEAEFRRRIEGS